MLRGKSATRLTKTLEQVALAWARGKGILNDEKLNAAARVHDKFPFGASRRIKHRFIWNRGAFKRTLRELKKCEGRIQNPFYCSLY